MLQRQGRIKLGASARRAILKTDTEGRMVLWTESGVKLG